jgi:hypothetical protein
MVVTILKTTRVTLQRMGGGEKQQGQQNDGNEILEEGQKSSINSLAKDCKSTWII